MSGSAFAVTHYAFSSGAGRTSDGNGSHASTLKSPSYTKSVSWQHYRTADRNRSHWSTSKTPSYTKSVSWHHHLNPDDHKHSLEEYCDDLRKSILASVLIMLGVLFIVIAIGFYSGKFRIIYPLEWKDAVSATGIFILSWSTLFQLGWRNASWKGCRLDELVGLAIFRHVFIFGSFLSLLYFTI